MSWLSNPHFKLLWFFNLQNMVPEITNERWKVMKDNESKAFLTEPWDCHFLFFIFTLEYQNPYMLLPEYKVD